MELARQHREEVLRGVAPNRRAKALLASVGECQPEIKPGVGGAAAWQAFTQAFRASRKTG